ncbi:uncharacterized protein LOC130589472 [Beta vulgaris subsp. vulgaris]|uniref:uncharacterized protein LOC130589472 n=1 Tax=Beta vulgaris subsp. vulgaris TaxID=3555 RepID=UPI002549A999|nr:uncharacterized protein LOC130589472 [Beta vulgaris subsp. vulgaris]
MTANVRNTRSRGKVTESQPEVSEESSDEDFELLDDDDSSGDDIFETDFIEDEIIIDAEDEIGDKEFEDHLDGSAATDKLYENGKIWREAPFGSIKLEPWLIFPNKEEFLQVLRDFCIQEGFGLNIEKTDRKRFTATYIMECCEWRIHASIMSDDVSWAIKTLRGEHTTCGRLEENPMVTSKWLCNKLADEVRGNPDIPVESLQRISMNRYRLRVKKRLLYKVRSMARVELYGGFDESYGLLPRYAEVIKETNLGSYALISWTGDTAQSQPKFKSCFIAFSAQIKGFIRGCRPIIRIDGAHLSGGYKGVMLTAVSIDGNNELFVIAYAIVPTESIDSWSYFFSNLKLIFQQEGYKRTDWTFISDRMRGVE